MTQRNKSNIWHLRQLNRAVLMHAKYTSHQFAPHYHKELSVGVIEKGHLNVRIGRNSRTILSAGDVIIINPGEIHEGFADKKEGCTYRMFYLPTKLVGKAAGTEKQVVPRFTRSVMCDSTFARRLVWLHRNLTTPSISILEYETHLLELLNGLIGRYAESGPQTMPHSAPNAKAIRQAQAYLAAHSHQKVTLNTLAAQVNYSPYHFLRIFKATVGMTPHAFQMQMRIDRAKSQLIKGDPIAQVAVDLGFYDQSHFTKRFTSLVGVTPQRYRQNRNFFQDNVSHSN